MAISTIRRDHYPPQLALPLIALLSLASWVQVIGVVWGGWTVTSAVWAGVTLALPIAGDIAQLQLRR